MFYFKYALGHGKRRGQKVFKLYYKGVCKAKPLRIGLSAQWVGSIVWANLHVTSHRPINSLSVDGARDENWRYSQNV